MNVLYITHDGITDHIGQSQIAPYLLGISKSKVSVSVLSVEKKANKSLITFFKPVFSKSKINWSYFYYSNALSFFSFFLEVIFLSLRSYKIIKNNNIDTIHCRCYPAAFVGLILKTFYPRELKLIFDVRDFWLDTRIETRSIKLPYRFLKLMERKLYHKSNVFITLTDRAQQIIKARFKSEVEGKDFYVIPCCADFSLFDENQIRQERKVEIKRKLFLSEKNFILGYLGSLGSDYLLEEMVQVFKVLLDIKKDSIFLFISNNGKDQAIKAFKDAELDLDLLRFISIKRAEVPVYLSLLDLSIIFIRPSESKAGCSPTKLAELFAMNVPVVVNKHVGDMDNLISLNKNCSSLVSIPVSREEVTTNLKEIISLKDEYKKIRKNSLNFSLETGIETYLSMYNNLGYD